MTQEEQTALVDGQAAAVAAAPGSDNADTKKEADQQVSHQDADAAAKGCQANENQTQMRALFKQIIRMRSMRKLSPAAKAAKAAKQAAKAAANAAKMAEIAAEAADNAAKAAQVAAQAALDVNTKEDEKKAAAAVAEKSADEAKSEETGKQEEVAAK